MGGNVYCITDRSIPLRRSVHTIYQPYATLHNTYTNRRTKDAKTLNPIVKYLKINCSSDTNAADAEAPDKNPDIETHTNQTDHQ